MTFSVKVGEFRSVISSSKPSARRGHAAHWLSSERDKRQVYLVMGYTYGGGTYGVQSRDNHVLLVILTT